MFGDFETNRKIILPLEVERLSPSGFRSNPENFA